MSTACGRRRRRMGDAKDPAFPDARSSSIKKTRRSSSFPVAPFRVVVAMRELLSVGDAWVDPRDVAGISRGVGTDALTLTVHTFPPRRSVSPSWTRRASSRGSSRVFRVRGGAHRGARPHPRRVPAPPGSLWSDPSNANKRLLVLVNPAAGKGRGVEAYERDVAPVLACLTSFRPRKRPASPAGGSGASPPPSPTPSPTRQFPRGRPRHRPSRRRADGRRHPRPRRLRRRRVRGRRRHPRRDF